MLNSYDPYLMKVLREVGIYAITSISYIPQSDADELGQEWLMAGW